MMMMHVDLTDHGTKIGEIAYRQNFISGFAAQSTVLNFRKLKPSLP